MGLFGAGAFSPQALENASSIINGGGFAQQGTDEDRLRKLLEQLHGGGKHDPYGVGQINVTDPNRYNGGGGLMNFFQQ